MTDTLAGRLQSIVGPAHVLSTADLRAGYETDWMGRRFGAARAVVRPATAHEVAAVVSACADAGVAVVAQGGNTGLVGGGIPRGGEVVLSTRRLASVGPVDGVAATIAVGAGATLAAVRAAALAAGFDVPVDLAARDSATIGGMVATNAGGLRVLRHGAMRASVAGLVAVTAAGHVWPRMAGLRKDNAGFDLTGLLCGSEGTLAVVTDVLLRLIPSAPSRVTVAIGLPGLDEALDVVARAGKCGAGVEVAEVMFSPERDLVRSLFGVPSPVEDGYCVLLLEAAGDDADTMVEALAPALAGLGEAAVATEPVGRARLWAARERLPEAVVRLGGALKLDVSLPLAALASFERDVRTALAGLAPDATVLVYGHVGDGSLHVNVSGDEGAHGAMMATVLTMVAERGGSVSAEHGLGVDKAAWLGATRSPAEVEAMWAIKDALDPGGILNPGVIFATGGRPPGGRERSFRPTPS